jgi:hypothetical protein
MAAGSNAQTLPSSGIFLNRGSYTPYLAGMVAEEITAASTAPAANV